MKLYEITHCKFYIFIFIGILIVTTAELTIRTQLFSDIFTPPLMLYMFTQLIIFMFSASIIHEIGHYLTALLINQKSKPFFKWIAKIGHNLKKLVKSKKLPMLDQFSVSQVKYLQVSLYTCITAYFRLH